MASNRTGCIIHRSLRVCLIRIVTFYYCSDFLRIHRDKSRTNAIYQKLSVGDSTDQERACSLNLDLPSRAIIRYDFLLGGTSIVVLSWGPSNDGMDVLTTIMN